MRSAHSSGRTDRRTRGVSSTPKYETNKTITAHVRCQRGCSHRYCSWRRVDMKSCRFHQSRMNEAFRAPTINEGRGFKSIYAHHGRRLSKWLGHLSRDGSECWLPHSGWRPPFRLGWGTTSANFLEMALLSALGTRGIACRALGARMSLVATEEALGTRGIACRTLGARMSLVATEEAFYPPWKLDAVERVEGLTVGSQSGRALPAGNMAALKDGGVAIYISELCAADSSDLARSNIVLRSRVLFFNNLWPISPEVKPEMNVSLTFSSWYLIEETFW